MGGLYTTGAWNGFQRRLKMILVYLIVQKVTHLQYMRRRYIAVFIEKAVKLDVPNLHNFLVHQNFGSVCKQLKKRHKRHQFFIY